MEQFGPGQAVFLGLIEGLTEFLPVSSTGHLILAGHWLGFTGTLAVSVDICIQFGSILAIVVYERAKILTLLGKAVEEQAAIRRMIHTHRETRGDSSLQVWGPVLRRSVHEHRNLWFLIGLGVAFLPAAIVGLLTHDWIETYLFSPKTVAISLIVGGLIILFVEMRPKPIRYSELEQVGLRTAFGVGIAQCAALIPGMSRSGSTIVGGLLLGVDRKVATEYSFFLALPTMFAATGYKFMQSYHLFSAHDAAALALGMVVSFFVAWAVIALFLSFVKRHTLRVFAYYRVAVGMILLLLI